MSVGTDFGYFVYTSDDGNGYAVKISKYYGNIVAYGFGAYDGTKPLMPRGMTMRGINVMDPTSKAKRRIPVGDVAAAAWTTPATVHTVPFVGDADGLVMEFQSRFPEKTARVPHVVVNF